MTRRVIVDAKMDGQKMLATVVKLGGPTKAISSSSGAPGVTKQTRAQAPNGGPPVWSDTRRSEEPAAPAA